jgi:hypothetical protein
VLYWSVSEDKMKEGIKRFRETKGATPAGVQLLARRHQCIDGQTLFPRLPRRAMRVGDMRPPLRAPA